MQAKEAKRGELYKKLGETQLTAQQLGLMQSSGSLGKRDTLREVMYLRNVQWSDTSRLVFQRGLGCRRHAWIQAFCAMLNTNKELAEL